VEYKQPIKIGEDIEATFYDAGHVLGSSIIKVNVCQNGRCTSVLFTGDMGRPDRPIVRDPTSFEEADYLLIESTYGDRIHKGREYTKKTFADVINSTKKAGGNIIVPSFALERSQEVLYYINELLLEDAIPHIMVFLDSPMAASITKVFQRHSELFDEQTREFIRKHGSPFEFPGLKFVETTKESKAINHIKGTIMIIAGSGMCTGGRIKHHLVNNITRPECTIMFVGYQANGTLGRQIVSGKEEVRILGLKYPVRARVVQVSGFSAHADREELLRWLTGFKKPPRRLFVVHGEPQSAQHFAEHISKEIGWNVSVPAYQDEFVLD
jgi:metallo-beta-lactamase family protein